MIRSYLRGLRERRFVTWAGMLLLFLLLLYWRRPAQLRHPQIWDEDGAQIIPGLLAHGLASFFQPLNGYLNMLPRALIGTSLVISSRFLPAVSAVLAWLFSGGVAMAIAFSPTWIRARKLAAIATLLVPCDPEVFGLPLDTFWWASLLLFLVVLWDERSEDRKWRLGFVVLGGLTSPVIFLITPFLVLRVLFFKRRFSEIAVLAVALGCCLLQGIFVLQAPVVRGGLTATNLRLIFPKFLGSYVVGNLGQATDKTIWFAAGLVLAFAIACALY